MIKNTETIEIINDNSEFENWEIKIDGYETKKLLDKLNIDSESKVRLLSETSKILSKCGNPNKNENKETGLVFGYIQSGKTLSFTTLITLAKDNGYKLIIVIAGIATNLVNQSHTRLEKDLSLDEYSRFWTKFKNPKNKDDKEIKKVIHEWKSFILKPEVSKTILITVMKNGTHLKNLTNILKRIELENVPTLIIDDEGDQATPNTKASKNAKNLKDGIQSNEESTIYQRIDELKSVIPHHTFIQYTATPQAQLFISIFDKLSPNFIELLTPGEKYTGGKVFFKTKKEQLIKPIPNNEIISDELGSFEEPPETLLEALRIFFLGVSAGNLKNEHLKSNRSMMIHPSQLVEKHGYYYNWVVSITNRWFNIFRLENSNIDKIQLINQFQKSYQDLKVTVPDIPEFEVLINNDIDLLIHRTQIKEINSLRGNNTEVDWKSDYSFILVGGNALNRGYTVEGLTVSYMPRSIGTGNADTMQQRARFFGYKYDYIGYCRVYLDFESITSYEDYVEHEEDMRRRLFEHRNSGKSLKEWYREVFLASPLRPTRPNVLSDKLEREKFGDQWFWIKYPHYESSMVSHNKEVIERYKDTIFSEVINTFSQRKSQIKRKSKEKLKDVYNRLLTKLRFGYPEDLTDYNSLLYMLKLYFTNNPNADCLIYFISYDKPRIRSLNSENQIAQLFQGAKSTKSEEGKDRDLKESDLVSIQIHNLDLKSKKSKNIKYSSVPSIAIWLPNSVGKEVIRFEIKDENND